MIIEILGKQINLRAESEEEEKLLFKWWKNKIAITSQTARLIPPFFVDGERADVLHCELRGEQ